MLVKLASVIGAGTLVVLALWGWVLIAAPRVQPLPVERAGAAAPVSAPKLRDVTAQPHTTSPPQFQSIAAKPAPIPPAAPAPLPAAAAAPVAVAAPVPVVPTTRDIGPAAAPAPAAPAPPPPGAEDTPRGADVAQGAAEPDPGPADDAPDTAAPAAAAGAPAPHSARCQRYRTYNPTTQTYRGFDGVVHPCRAR